MHDDQIETAAVELLPTTSTQQGRYSDTQDNNRERRSLERTASSPVKDLWLRYPWLPGRDEQERAVLGLVLLNAIPILVLALCAPSLSTKLGSLACLPNGNFILPGTASIWNPEYFFIITITLGVHSQWGYTHVKIIDVLWDVLVGRGAQTVMIWIAYRVFSKCIRCMMQTQSVSYRLYGAVAFDTATLRSIVPQLQAVVVKGRASDWRTRRMCLAMALTTFYIAAMPTLFSAMTGYGAISLPSIELANGIGASPEECQDNGNCTILACSSSSPDEYVSSGLTPVWGIVWDSNRYSLPGVTVAEPDYVFETTHNDADPAYSYYNKYKDDYLAAASSPDCVSNRVNTSLTDCAPLNKSSTFSQWTLHDGQQPVALAPPMLNIEVLGTEASGAANAFICNLDAYDSNPVFFYTRQINKEGPDGISALCTSPAYYQWGFSFLLLFIVCILNLLFAATMYGLWIDTRRDTNIQAVETDFSATDRVRGATYPNHLRSVLEITSQAEKEYGEQIRKWPSWKLDKVVWRGKKGMKATPE